MGVDIIAKLLYGIPYSDLPAEILEEVDEMLDNDELDYASPWYDCERERWIVGVGCAVNKQGHVEWDGTVIYKLEKLLGSRGSFDFFITPHVW